MRRIKKYANRKLYDLQDKKYVSLFRIGEMMEEGEEIHIIDNQTGEDITAQVISQILSKKKADEELPPSMLMQLLRKGSDRLGGYVKKTSSVLQSAKTFAEDEIEKLVSAKGNEKHIPDIEANKLEQDLSERTDKLKTWIGEKVDQRMTEVLRLMNLPTKDDIDKLMEQIDHLSQKVDSFESKIERDVSCGS